MNFEKEYQSQCLVIDKETLLSKIFCQIPQKLKKAIKIDNKTSIFFNHYYYRDKNSKQVTQDIQKLEEFQKEFQNEESLLKINTSELYLFVKKILNTFEKISQAASRVESVNQWKKQVQEISKLCQYFRQKLSELRELLKQQEISEVIKRQILKKHQREENQQKQKTCNLLISIQQQNSNLKENLHNLKQNQIESLSQINLLKSKTNSLQLTIICLQRQIQNLNQTISLYKKKLETLNSEVSNEDKEKKSSIDNIKNYYMEIINSMKKQYQKKEQMFRENLALRENELRENHQYQLWEMEAKYYSFSRNLRNQQDQNEEQLLLNYKQLFKPIIQTFNYLSSILKKSRQKAFAKVVAQQLSQKSSSKTDVDITDSNIIQPSRRKSSKTINIHIQTRGDQIKSQDIQKSYEQMYKANQKTFLPIEELIRKITKNKKQKSHFIKQLTKVKKSTQDFLTNSKQSFKYIYELQKLINKKAAEIQKSQLQFAQLQNLKQLYSNIKAQQQDKQQIVELRKQIKSLKKELNQHQQTKTESKISDLMIFLRSKEINQSKKLSLSSNINNHTISRDYNLVVNKVKMLEQKTNDLSSQLTTLRLQFIQKQTILKYIVKIFDYNCKNQGDCKQSSNQIKYSQENNQSNGIKSTESSIIGGKDQNTRLNSIRALIQSIISEVKSPKLQPSMTLTSAVIETITKNLKQMEAIFLHIFEEEIKKNKKLKELNIQLDKNLEQQKNVSCMLIQKDEKNSIEIKVLKEKLSKFQSIAALFQTDS